jgi:hypothetical protein
MYYYDGVGGDSYSKYVWDLDPDPAAGATITMDFLYEVDDVISDWGGEKEIILYNLAASGSGLCGFGVNPDDLGTTGHEVTLHSESTASSTSGEDWIDDDTQYCIRLVCTTADDDVEVWIDATGGGATDLSDCGQTSAHTHNGGGSNTDVGTLVLGLQRINKSAIYIDNIEVSW